MFPKIIPTILFIVSLLFHASTGCAYTENLEKISGQYSAGRGEMASPVGDYMVVTSPQGWRIHPITGKRSYHAGVDLAIEDNDPIYAAADGVVYSAGWNDGYGETVAINHGNNLFTLYGHNNHILVVEGDAVKKGQLIAYGGRTGNSTGPHCHFEVLPNGYYGDPVDPGLYVPGLLELEKAQGGGLGGGAPMDAHGAHKDWVVATDFAKPMREVIEKSVEMITKGLALIKGYVAELFFILVSMDLAIGAMKKAMTSTKEDREGLFRWIVKRGLFYGLCMVLLFGWTDFVGNLSLHGLPALGALAGGASGAGAAEAAVSDPTLIVQKGMNIVAPIINESMEVHGILDLVLHGAVSVICIVFGVILFVLFCIIGYQIALAYLEFYFSVLFSFTAFPFAGIAQLRKYASNGITGVMAASLNLMFFCLFAVMLQTAMESVVVDGMLTQQTVSAEASKVLPDGMIGQTSSPAGMDLTGKPKAELAYLVQSILRTRYGRELRADFIWSQLAHESAYFTSKFAIEDHNYGGMGCDGHGNFRHYDSDEEFAEDYAATLSYYAPDGLFEATTVQEYAEALKHGGYYEASVEQYVHGMSAALNGGGTVVQSVVNIYMLLKLLLVVLMYMFFADRMHKFIHSQFTKGNGFRLSKAG